MNIGHLAELGGVNIDTAACPGHGELHTCPIVGALCGSDDPDGAQA